MREPENLFLTVDTLNQTLSSTHVEGDGDEGGHEDHEGPNIGSRNGPEMNDSERQTTRMKSDDATCLHAAWEKEPCLALVEG